MAYIDLTHTIENNLIVYPGEDRPKLHQTRFLEKDSYNNYNLEINMHTGTHIDGPMHLTTSNRKISEFSIDNFIGNGCLINVKDKPVIELKDEYDLKIKKGDIVLFYTGHSEKFNTMEYYNDYAVITNEFAAFLAEKEIKMIGIDSPSPDKFPFDVHNILLNKGILIIENLCNLDKLIDITDFEIISLPLKVNTDSAIIRIVAKTE